MGCEFDAWVACEDRDTASEALARMRRFIEAAEQTMSRFRPDSELSGLNCRSGEVTRVSEMLLEVIGHAVDAAAKSDGIYDPTVLSALMAAGYDRSFELVAESDASSTSVTLASTLGLYREIEIDRSARTVRMPRGAQIDLGGIGKAWASREAANLLSQTGPCIVSAGGDVAIAGGPYPGEGWPVAIEDPFGGDSPLLTLDLSSGGVATSGVNRRNWRKDGKTQHHLIDPRTGRPADTDLVCATAVASDLLVAERIALTTMTLGSVDGLSRVAREPGVEAAVVLKTGELVLTSGFKRLIGSGGAPGE